MEEDRGSVFKGMRLLGLPQMTHEPESCSKAPCGEMAGHCRTQVFLGEKTMDPLPNHLTDCDHHLCYYVGVGGERS